MMEISIKD